MRPPVQMNEPFSISCCRRRSGGVQTNCEKFLLDSRNGCCACAARILRTDVGRCPDAPLPTSNTYCYPCALPFNRPIDLACRVGARWIIFLVEPRAFSRQYRYPEAPWILLAVLTVLTAVYFVGSWNCGLKYQGRRFTYSICALNAGWLVLLWTAFILRGNTPFICSQSRSALAVVCVAWLVRLPLSRRIAVTRAASDA